MNGRLIVVSGPSGSGKTTIIRRLLETLDLEFSVSATTRVARPGERHGADYYFVTKDDFETLIEEGALLEWAVYSGHYYGTPALPIDAAIRDGHDVLLDIEILGARQIREKRPDALMVFIAPPSIDELETRLRGRGDTSEEDMAGRLEIARIQLEQANDLFDHVVVNVDVETATTEIANLINQAR